VKVVHSTWASATLDDIGDIFCGQSASAAEVNSEGKGDVYITGPEQWDGRSLHVNKWTEHPRRVVPEGCIFITVKGAGVGKIFPGIAAAIGRDIYAYKPSCEVDAAFVRHAIQHRVAMLIGEARGDIPGLSKDHLAEHKLALPPLAEQRRIVLKLNLLAARLARARAELDRSSQLADRFRLSALRAGVMGKLTEHWRVATTNIVSVEVLLRDVPVPQQGRGGREATDKIIPGVAGLAVNDPGTILPNGWKWVPLLRVAKQETGHTPSRSQASFGTEGWLGSAFAMRALITAGTLRKLSKRFLKPALPTHQRACFRQVRSASLAQRQLAT
jgi:type I restriction enzyme, S subunit